MTGVGSVVIGMTPAPPAPAPLPETAFTVASGSAAVTARREPIDAEPATPPGPNRLVVGSLRIDAPLTGETLEGDRLVVPGDPGRVGWWTGGAALDASTGTTLLAGHVDRAGRLGALHDLYRISPGARVLTTDARGRTSAWRVVSLQARPKADLPVFAASGPRRLAIVTCGGAVVRTDDGTGYADNVIVVAEPERADGAPARGV